jgi:hypothetical protein
LKRFSKYSLHLKQGKERYVSINASQSSFLRLLHSLIHIKNMRLSGLCAGDFAPSHAREVVGHGRDSCNARMKKAHGFMGFGGGSRNGVVRDGAAALQKKNYFAAVALSPTEDKALS